MQLRKAGKLINDAIAVFGTPPLCCAIGIHWSNTVEGEDEIGRNMRFVEIGEVFPLLAFE